MLNINLLEYEIDITNYFYMYQIDKSTLYSIIMDKIDDSQVIKNNQFLLIN